MQFTRYEPKATIASIVPFKVDCRKIGIHPGDYFIDASDGKNFVTKIVVPGKYHVYMGYENAQKYLNIDAPPHEIARAIVEDFARSVIGIIDGGGPGIFWVPEEMTFEQIQVKFPKEVEDARQRQLMWFRELVRMADDDWTKSNHRHSAISNLQRFAAKFLLFKRDWLEATEQNPELLNLIPCMICTTMINKAAIKCPNCGSIVKMKEWNEYQEAMQKEQDLFAGAGKTGVLNIPKAGLTDLSTLG